VTLVEAVQNAPVRERQRFSADYWRFWTAAALSNLGDGMRLAALPLAAVSITREPLAVTTVGALAFLPMVLVGPIAGVVVDRVDRRTLMIVGQLARGVVVGGLAVWIATGDVSLPVLYAAAFLLGLGEVFVDTASQAAIPMLAPPGPGGLEAANGTLIAAETVLNDVAGAPVGAFLFAIGAAVPFFGDAASFLVGAVLLSMVRTPLQTERLGAPAPVLEEIREGLALLWQDRLLRGLAIGVSLVNVTLSAAAVVLVLFAIEDLGLSEAGFGLLLGVGAVGGVVGSLVASSIARRLGRPAAMSITGFLVAGAVGLVALAETAAAAAALQFVTFLSVVVFNVIGRSLRQAVTPDRLLGRIVASFRVIAAIGVPVGAVLGGIVAGLTSVRTVFALAGALTLVPAVVIMVTTRHIPVEHR
jgi:MFS family permease